MCYFGRWEDPEAALQAYGLPRLNLQLTPCQLEFPRRSKLQMLSTATSLPRTSGARVAIWHLSCSRNTCGTASEWPRTLAGREQSSRWGRKIQQLQGQAVVNLQRRVRRKRDKPRADNHVMDLVALQVGHRAQLRSKIQEAHRQSHTSTPPAGRQKALHGGVGSTVVWPYGETASINR
jgi:hypothetical protein